MIADTVTLLADALQLGERASNFSADTPLLGSLPELDSMAVVSVLTLAEDRFGIIVDDDDISAEVFETVGTLAEFLAAKVDDA